ncbi:MAG: TonB-dependent receptor, partial [Candidatus Zixiibacteriota bacterium]
MKLKLVVAVMLFASIAGSVWGGVTGKITGVITDAQTNEPLVGVTVAVEGTNLGAITDQDGRYMILNVPAGTYTLKISSVGYASVEVANVEVTADLATYQDQALSSKATDIGKTIQVTAEAPLVVKDKTNSINIVKQEEIQALPTRGFEQIVGIQNSVVRVSSTQVGRQRGTREATNSGELHIRGGRRSEVAYYVDGFSQQDPLTGLSTANIANNAIQEVTVIEGGFPAEYGHVTSGIVNTITRSGGPEYHGNVEALSDNITSDNYDNNWYSADLGGPIPGLQNAYFFGSIERRWLGDREPSAIGKDVFPQFDGKQPNNWSSTWSYQGKLTFDLTPTIKLMLNGNGSKDEWRQYLNTYRNNQDHIPYYKDKNIGLNAKWTQTINERTFYNLSVSFFQTERFRGDGLFRENLAAYSQPGGNPRLDSLALFWVPGHVFDDYLKRKSSYIGAKGDLNIQANEYHTLKLGFDFQRHTLRSYQHLFPARISLDANGNPILYDTTGSTITVDGGFTDVNRYGYDLLGNESDEAQDFRNQPKNPINIAGYIQDRFEWRGMIVNAGLRLDIFDYKTLRVKDPTNPFNPFGSQDGTPDASILQEKDLESSKTFTRLSPRLGIAFPVSDRTQLHLNYGKFFQRPDLERLYVGWTY